MIPAPDAGNEFAGRNRSRTLRDRFLQLGNGKSAFDATRFMSRIDPGAGVMQVCIDKSGNNGSAAEVNRGRARTERHRPPNSNDAAILDRERRSDNAAPVHKLSVHQGKIGADILRDERPGGLTSNNPCGAADSEFQQLPTVHTRLPAYWLRCLAA